ncbi:MAG: hypothetical protein HOC23_18775 [Halieaceae bacterium]|jgi:tetratricopeptide (TPR) repeat protein|nr:hypothetical protein [Halieaceae bacterium]
MQHISAARELSEQGKLEAAEASYQAHLEEQPGDIESIGFIVAMRTQRDQWSEAEQLLHDQLQQLPQNAQLHYMLGDIKRAKGEMHAAGEAYASALSYNPTYGAAALMLAEIKQYDDDQTLLEQFEHEADSEDLASYERANFHFAAGKVAGDMGEFGRAFNHYRLANQWSRKDTRNNKIVNVAQRSKTAFSKKYLRSMKKAGCRATSPLFIVGMPRTGTTLLEQMLGRHPRVQAQGELQQLDVMSEMVAVNYNSNLNYPDSMQQLTPEDATRFGEIYVRQTIDKFSNRAQKYSVDKNPINFLYLGMLKIILPRAKVIHIRRHPLDTCLSCYFKSFSGVWDITSSIESLAQTYRAYREIMDHWHKVLPGQILDIDYEDLVDKPEITMRRVMAHCGLDWDDQCLSSGGEIGPIRTASFWQARQPIYKSSLDRWRNYRPYIGPLIEMLDDYLDADMLN